MELSSFDTIGRRLILLDAFLRSGIIIVALQYGGTHSSVRNLKNRAVGSRVIAISK